MGKTPKRQSNTLTRRIRRRWTQFKWVSFIIGGFLFVNFVVQIARKPTEALGLMPTTSKTPMQTWQSYREEFVSSSTNIITADFLAAIAQVESAGDPVAQPPWVFRWTTDIFRVYAPQSTAVGLMQITEGNYAEAKNYCIRDGRVETHCWLNNLYARFWPSHSIQMAAGFMHVQVERFMALHGVKNSNLENQQKLAALIHLCGKGRAPEFIKNQFKIGRGFQKCGTHDPNVYLQKVAMYKRQFSRMLASQ
jgi:hypothetical protein